MSDHEKLALVTGTSSGIGAAIARDLLARAWRVVGVSRRDAGIIDYCETDGHARFEERAYAASN